MFDFMNQRNRLDSKFREKLNEDEDYDSLSKKEKKIYDSIMSKFPNTSHESAFNKALEGGMNFQFINNKNL